MPTELHNHAARFYLMAAQDTALAPIMTEDASRRLADLFEVCHRHTSRKSTAISKAKSTIKTALIVAFWVLAYSFVGGLECGTIQLF